MKQQTVRNIILINGIIPGTFLFLLSVFWLFQFALDIFYDWKTFLLILCFLLGIIGYLGLWRNLILSQNRVKLNSYLLGFGIIGCLTFITFEGGERAIKWIISDGKYNVDLATFSFRHNNNLKLKNK